MGPLPPVIGTTKIAPPGFSTDEWHTRGDSGRPTPTRIACLPYWASSSLSDVMLIVTTLDELFLFLAAGKGLRSRRYEKFGRYFPFLLWKAREPLGFSSSFCSFLSALAIKCFSCCAVDEMPLHGSPPKPTRTSWSRWFHKSHFPCKGLILLSNNTVPPSFDYWINWDGINTLSTNSISVSTANP